MREGTLQRQLVWLMILRVVIITTLMGTLLIVQLSPEGRDVPSFDYIYRLAGITYGLSVVYLLLHRRARASRAYVYLQFLGDVAVISGLVYYTGGPDSPFSFLYLLSIITAAILLYRRGGLLIASVSAIAYGTLVDLLYLGVLPFPGGEAPPDPPPGSPYYTLFLHFFAFYAVALLVSYISEGLRRAGSQLEEQRGHLADLRAFHQLVIDGMSGGLIVLDLEGRITKVNQVALQITGYREEELLGRSLLALLDLEAGLLRWLRLRLSRRRIYRFDRQVTRRDGRPIPVGVSVSRLTDESLVPLGYIVIFQDLTELRKLEEELRIRDRLAVVGEMAASVAHEIRNPLASISGSVQLLENEASLSGEERHLMSIIHRESRRLDRTIQDFLAFARPTSLEHRPVSLSALARDTATLLRNSEELLPGQAISLDLPPEEVLIRADGDRIQQVVWNVCRNALRAMPGGGTLTLRLHPAQGGEATLEFVDQGPGFEEGKEASLFRPFVGSFQRGSGLGLAIVLRIVRDHGGRVSLENNPGGGATVRVVLPLEGGPPGAGAESGGRGEGRQRRRALEAEAGRARKESRGAQR